MNLSFSLERADLEAFSTHRSKTTQQRFYRVMWWWFLILLLVLTVVDALKGRVVRFGVWACLVLLWLLFGHRSFAWLQLFLLRKSLEHSDLSSLIGDQHLSIEDNCLRCRSQGGETLIKWSSIKRVEQTDAHAFIYVNDISALIIPRTSVTSGILGDFLAAVRQRIAAA